MHDYCAYYEGKAKIQQRIEQAKRRHKKQGVDRTPRQRTDLRDAIVTPGLPPRWDVDALARSGKEAKLR